MVDVSTNAFAAFWAKGYRHLVPIIPPGAPISANSSIQKRLAAGKDDRGKTPGVRNSAGLWHGFDWLSADADPQDIQRWHAMGAGVGIKTGALGDGTSLVMIDADTKNLELARIIRNAIEKRFGEKIPVRIGNDPKAGYPVRVDGPFQYTRIEFGERTPRGDLADRVEILSDGRQFVAHGIHPGTMKPYRWPRDVPALSDVPVVSAASLHELLADLQPLLPAATAIKVEGSAGLRSEVDQSTLRGDPDLVRKAVAALPNTIDVTREEYVRVGAALKGALPDDVDAAREMFRDWAEQWPGAVDGSGPTALGDMADQDFDRIKAPYELGARYLFDMAAEKGNGAFSLADVWFDQASAEKAISLSPPEVPGTPLRAGRISAADLLNLPPRQWLYGHKVSRKYVTFVASPGGVGKTAWVFALALACASHRKLLHDQTRKPLKVWIYNLEDDMVELRRRFAAAMLHYDLPPEVLDNIRINSGRDRRFKIVSTNKDGGFVVHPDFRAIIDEMKAEEIDLLIVDPYLRSHGVSENENEAQDEVMRLYAQIAEETNAGIILVHHTKKGAIAGDMDSLRGGSTQGGGARAAFTLSPMAPEEAGRLGIPEEQRRLYVRIDDAKNNMAPTGVAEWMQLVGVSLNNRSDDYPQGDNVQVATPWAPPEAFEGFEDPTVVEALRALDAGLPDGERYSLRAQDKGRWAGDVLMADFGRTRSQALSMLAEWMKAGVIAQEAYKSPSQRKNRNGVVVKRELPDAMSLSDPEVSGSVFE